MDPICDIDLKAIKADDIIPSEATMDEIANLEQEMMPDARGIAKLGHDPFVVYEGSANLDGGDASKSKDSLGSVVAPEGQNV